MKRASHLSLASLELAPSTEWKLDAPAWCFIRVSEGHGYWLNETVALELSRGHAVVLSPAHTGCFRASQIGPATLHYFRFLPELSDGLLTAFEHDVFESLTRDSRRSIRVFAPETPTGKRWQQLIASFPLASALSERVELLGIIATVFGGDLRRPSPSEKPFLSARVKLRLLLNELPESEFFKLTPEELASHCGVSIMQAKRSFRRLFGLSLVRRQRLIRLQRARQRLHGANANLKAIAVEAGFRGAKEFSAAFKRQFGVLPEEWKGHHSSCGCESNGEDKSTASNRISAGANAENVIRKT